MSRLPWPWEDAMPGKTPKSDTPKFSIQDLAMVSELLAFLRLGITHCSAEGAGLVTALMLSPAGRIWRVLPRELRARVEERERVIEPAFLEKVSERRLRDGPSPALRVLASQYDDADVGALDG